MSFLNTLMKPIMRRITKNRWDYNDQELNKAAELGLFDVIDLKAMRHWIVADPICSVHCSGCHNEGRPLYFNALGMLIRHKCPSGICIHGLSQLSPIIYNYYDYMLQGKDPSEMIFNHATCTDIGLEMGGLGNNLFRVTYEKMPFLEFLRFMLTMTPYLFIRNKRARGQSRVLKETVNKGGAIPDEYMKGLPLEQEELESFLASPKRVKRLRAIEKFRNHHIVVRVVSSNACIAGHKKGDEFLIDSMGLVLPRQDEKGVCIMALTKIWWRVMLMLERMANAENGKGDFKSKLFDLPINCYGTGLPLGACGEILMKVEVREHVTS
ncbi:MAG: hypothetical protein JW976_02070 [Syntrophaceae bacterium]|nr:hypothetical protein [Syntrophaceae bacterium]